MKRDNLWSRLLVLTGATLFVAVAVACGDDDNGAGSSGNGDGTSGGSNGSNGVSSGGFGTTSSGGNGTSGGASGTSGATGFDPDAACAATTVDAEKTPANILFIVDRSRSMRCASTTPTATCEAVPDWPSGNPASPTAKWNITREALKSVIAALPSTHSAGITYFNTSSDPDPECSVSETPNVPVKPITPDQLTLVNSSLDSSATQPEGLTPIVGAVTLGYRHLHTTPDFTGKKILVLLTDGAETCAPSLQEQFVTKTVVDARSVGITTFVIGAPGSEGNRAFLSRIAYNGGSARTPTCNHDSSPPDQGDCHFDLATAGSDLANQLNAALDTITKQALDCDFEVPTGTGPIDYGKVNVIYTPSDGSGPQTVVQDTKDCAQANGWQYSPDRKRITLCGQICETVKADVNGSVSIQLGCVTQTGPK